MSTITTLSIVCPKCHKQTVFTIDTAVEYSGCHCAACKTDFTVQLATVRSKSTRADKAARKNYHSVRIYTPSNDERLMDFETGLTPVEMKANDNVIFIYLNDVLHIVQNKTINQYYIVKDARFGWAGILVGVLFVLFIVFKLSQK